MKYNVKDTTKITDDYTKQLLRARGIEDIEHFLNPTEEHSLQSWNDLYDMEDCVKGMIATLELDKPHLALVVDCDVDGFTSAAILYQYIKDIKPNAEIDYYLHDGKQHGLSDTYNKILDKDEHYSLCLVPDAGSNDFEYIEKLGEHLTPTLILDHHIIEDSDKISDWCFKGKDMPDWFVAGAKAALQAPTAMNRQPFTLSLEKKDKVVLGKASGIDKGIIKYNFEVGAASKGCKKVNWK